MMLLRGTREGADDLPLYYPSARVSYLLYLILSFSCYYLRTLSQYDMCAFEQFTSDRGLNTLSTRLEQESGVHCLIYNFFSVFFSFNIIWGVFH